ncbi:PREDICTED: protein NYNRIN-like [Vollenhovia emeryi]|uniref:protein NYNRIN-like n=1 Tax=Vollenhovia emeryi TaxID=411798 RepID=UPI0005F4D67C|nr:PREDICTED: protein NYNRIN-like [Vollenhovia emeryi]
MDIVGPLQPSNGFIYCLTIIDRFSRWPEAIPLIDITARTIARAFFDNWVARFGAPSILTTDQGQQFEAQLFAALLKLIGCRRIRTTAYHPAANGMIERWHRTFKAAIMCHNTPNWVEVLPTVLLGLRTHVRMDTKASPAEFLYGTVLRIPGEFFLQEDFTPDPQIFIDDFRQHMRQVKPVPVAHHYKKRVFRFKELSVCSHVFLRKDAVKKPLERPYSGPFRVIERTSVKVYSIEINGRPTAVSVERLKPAHFVPDDALAPGNPSTSDATDKPPASSSV